MGKCFLGPEPASKTVSHITQISRDLPEVAIGWIVIQLSPDPVFLRSGPKFDTKSSENYPLVYTG